MEKPKSKRNGRNSEHNASKAYRTAYVEKRRGRRAVHKEKCSQCIYNGEPDAGEGQNAEKRFEDAVVAGACTLPMLELYQHVSIITIAVSVL